MVSNLLAWYQAILALSTVHSPNNTHYYYKLFVRDTQLFDSAIILKINLIYQNPKKIQAIFTTMLIALQYIT